MDNFKISLRVLLIPGLMNDAIPTAVVIQRPIKWEHHYEKNIMFRGRFANRNKALCRQYAGSIR
jgi:hypothetical protein